MILVNLALVEANMLLKFRLCTKKIIEGDLVTYECCLSHWKTSGSLDRIKSVRNNALEYWVHHFEAGRYSNLFDEEY